MKREKPLWETVCFSIDHEYVHSCHVYVKMSNDIIFSCFARNIWLSGSKKHMTQRQQECKKKGLKSKTTTLQVHHTFLYISLPFLHHYSIVMPNFMFYGECKQATTKFYFSLWAWIWSLGIQLEFGSLHLTKAVGRNNRDKNWKNINLQQAHVKQMHFWT